MTTCRKCERAATCEVADPAVGPLYYCENHCPWCSGTGDEPEGDR